MPARACCSGDTHRERKFKAVSAASWVLTLGFLFLLVLGVPIAFAIGITSVIVLWMLDIDLIVLAQRVIAGTQSFPLLAIPGFILAGDLMSSGGLSARLMQVADRLVTQLDGWAPGLRDKVVQRELLSPAAIETATGATMGHWHHGELTMHQSFMMRPTYGAAQYATPVDGLYLCGAGSHPGGGVHGLPGQLAARRILGEDQGK